MNSTTRRHFLIGASASLIAAASSSNSQEAQLQANRLFAHGIASGDPTQDSLIIWTRISVIVATTVRWQVSKDADFSQIVKQGERLANGYADYTVKVDVTGLSPGEVYYYRFLVGEVQSETGRTKTLTVGHLDKLSFAVVSCSNYPFGYFNAYEHIAEDDDIDFVLHLGDYIYEYSRKSWGSAFGVLLDREHVPANEIITLADYRARHAQYKTDNGSKLMHAAHPLIPTWDDHESTNNPYLHGAKNHQKNEGDWYTRRAASLQAYFEWMPIRDPKRDSDRAKLWRHFQFGDLASLVTLETRHTGRSKQLSYDTELADIKDQHSRDKFVEQQIYDPSRKVLHAEMEAFLVDKLSQSKSKQQPWRLIGNQIPMARVMMPDIRGHINTQHSDFSSNQKNKLKKAMQIGKWHLPVSLDTWNGYGAAREQFYNLCQTAHAEDLLVFTGDSHCFWANQLHSKNGTKMGFEIGTTSVTSPGSFAYFGPYTRKFEELLREQNEEVLWANCEHRGYVKTRLTAKHAKVDYIAMRTVTERSTESFIQRSMTIEHSNKGLEYSF
ncbi:alkaline phosphatase D family protein [uncultured Paraglaciecola sp.]|uniref:alkaline phosphatase D family protein n=1 Tax=uncultured Paraglaciecola sp. TaxID=1765024 RepID=UPI002628B3B6|nr:alkaline phosphatase D family protein [uncultured Paraglaciecola sp.]